MDAKTRLFLWTLAGCGFFAVLGGLFGAVSGLLSRRQGTAGSALGLRVAAAFEPLAPHTRAALVGTIDGLTFGAAVGAAVAFGFAYEGHDEWTRLRPVFGGALALVALAAVFGSIGHALGPHQRLAVSGLCGGGAVGVVLGYLLGGIDGLMFGALLGLVAGAASSFWLAGR